MISVNGVKIEPTIFPDNTSQVWKLPDSVIDFCKDKKVIEILWEFDNEAEFMNVVQLKTLLSFLNDEAYFRLHMPYLPYARQDKHIANDATFALIPFACLLEVIFDSIKVFDPHSKEIIESCFGRENVEIVEPADEIAYAVNDCCADMICYPDKGAAKRYSIGMPKIVLDKTRDQITGNVTGMVIDEEASSVTPSEVNQAHVLIVDDLCDGGRTFVEAAKILLEAGADRVFLYISHGLFTRPEGVNYLYDNGISRVYTKDGFIPSV